MIHLFCHTLKKNTKPQGPVSRYAGCDKKLRSKVQGKRNNHGAILAWWLEGFGASSDAPKNLVGEYMERYINIYTPRKINMEPTNHPLKKMKMICQLCSMLIFRCVYIPWYTLPETNSKFAPKNRRNPKRKVLQQKGFRMFLQGFLLGLDHAEGNGKSWDDIGGKVTSWLLQWKADL